MAWWNPFRPKPPKPDPTPVSPPPSPSPTPTPSTPSSTITFGGGGLQSSTPTFGGKPIGGGGGSSSGSGGGSSSRGGGGSSGGGSSSGTYVINGQTYSGILDSKDNQAELMAKAITLANQLKGTTLTGQLKAGTITSEQFNKQMADSGVIYANGRIIKTDEVKRTGGGSYDKDTGVFSSSEQNIKKVQEYANQMSIQDNIKKFEEVKKQEQIFQQQSKQGQSPFLNIAISNFQNQQKSVAMPSSETVAGLNKEYGGAFGIGKERYFSGQKIAPETLQKVYADVREKEYINSALEDINSYVKTDLNTYTLNRIDELRKDEDYVRKYNELQEKVNNGEDIDKINKELEKYDKERVLDIANKEAEEKYNKWFAEYSAGKGNNLSKDAVRDIIDFNSRIGKKFVNQDLKNIINSVKGGAIFTATTSLIFGALKSAGGKFATGAGIGQTALKVAGPVLVVAGAGWSIYERTKREQELKIDYGFSGADAMRIAKNEAMARELRMTELALGFSAGSIATSVVISTGVNQVKMIRANSDAIKFQKELITNPELTKKVYTKSNLERGFIIKDFNGVKVKIPVTEANYRNILALRQGKPVTIEKTMGVFSNKRAIIIDQINKQGYNFDSNANVQKTLVRAVSGTTNEPVGRLQEFYTILSGTGKNAKGFRFKITKAGKITNLESIETILQPNGKTLMISTKFGTTGETEGLFLRYKVNVPKVKQKFFESNVKVTSSKRVGDIKSEKGLFNVIKLQARRIGSIFERTPSKSQIVQEGKFNKISIIKQKDILGIDKIGKAQSEKGIFESTGKSVRKESLFDFWKTSKKPGKISDMLSKPTEKAPDSKSILFDDGNKQSLVNKQATESLFSDTLPPTGYSPKLNINIKSDVIAPKIDVKANLGGLIFGDMLKGSEDYQKSGSILGGLEGEKRVNVGKLDTGLVNREKDKSIFGLLPASGGSALGLSSISAVTQKPRQDVITLLQPIVSPIIKPKMITPRTKLIEPFFTQPIVPFGFGLGGIETGGGQKGIKKRKKPTGRVAYNPSLGSILLKQKKLKVTKSQAIALGRETFTGFELRPELEITNKKKKSIFNIF